MSKLKEIRERVHLTQQEMAERLHISQSAYSNLEMGKRSLTKDEIVKLIKEFGEDAADILENDGIIINVNAPNSVINSANSGSEIGHFYHYPKDLVEKIISGKDGEITHLKSVIEKLLDDNHGQKEI